MVKSFLTKSPSQTKKLGKILAEEILKTRLKKAVIVGLVGELGGGKTTFLQGFAKGLGIKRRILSPTFVIMRRFRIPNARFHDFFHIDCYRIQKPRDLLVLNWAKIISKPGNIIAVEWVDKIKKALPRSSITLKFDFIDEKTRKITLKSP